MFDRCLIDAVPITLANLGIYGGRKFELYVWMLVHALRSTKKTQNGPC